MTHRLLLADDSVTIQRVIELTFADEDVEVIAVGDGQMAIDRLNADPPDIVLADVDMPKRDGYEVAAYVKSRPKLAHIPVVLLTGAFEPIDQARATAAGSSDVLAKPFEPQMVINRVKELLGRKRPAEEYDAPPKPDLMPLHPPARDAGAVEPHSGLAPAGRTAVAPGTVPVSLDDYFDQLDAAFSNLQAGGAVAPAPEHDSPQGEMDWPVLEDLALPMASRPSALPSAPAAVLQAAPAPPQLVVAPAPGPMPIESPTLVVPPAPVAPPAPLAEVEPLAPAAYLAPVVAPIAPTAPVATAVAPPAPAAAPAARTTNLFAELSAAKAAAARPAPPVITEEVIEEVVSRVLQRLSDRVVRETVTEIVSKTAERLIQEEIERIKAVGQ